MAKPRVYRTQALVLKSAPMGEAGLLVTLYTRDAGKLKAVVRGARRPTSKMVGHLEPLNMVEMSLARSRPGGIDTVTQIQILDSFSSLKADLDAVSRGIYLAELVDGFGAEGSPNQELYSLLVDTLQFLNGSPGTDSTLRYFELHLLKCSGFMPQLYRCVECREELSPGKHLFSPDVGGTLCLTCTPSGARIMRLSVQTLKVLRFIDRASLEELSMLRINAGTGGGAQEFAVRCAEVLAGQGNPLEDLHRAPGTLSKGRSVNGARPILDDVCSPGSRLVMADSSDRVHPVDYSPDYSEEFYRHHARRYAEVAHQLIQSIYIRSSHPALKGDYDLLERLKELTPGPRGLDAGCGAGARDVYRFWLEGYDIIGIDAVEENILTAKSLHPEIADRVFLADLRVPWTSPMSPLTSSYATR